MNRSLAVRTAVFGASIASIGASIASIASIGACDGEGGRIAQPFTHEAYVWQRAWTPAVVDAVRTRAPAFDGLRVWAAEIEADGRVAYAAPPADVLAGPVIVVVRIDGSVPLDAAQVVPVVREALVAFDGADVRGVELDHDCATARLSTYAALLREVDAALVDHSDGDFALSITALPAWSSAPALDDLLAAVDHVVLQVHTVDAPRRGAPSLFTNARARAFVDAFAKRAAKADVAWRVALPAYGSSLTFDDGGRVVSVDSEAPRTGAPDVRSARTGRSEQREVWAEPAEVAALLRSLEVKRPRGMLGVVWFRLPVDGDRRAWSFATLEAVRAGHDLVARVDVIVRPSADSFGLHDVVIVNRGAVDARAPYRVEINVAGLAAADGVNGFSFDHGFSSLHPPRIAPAGELVVGWVRAQEVTAHEAR